MKLGVLLPQAEEIQDPIATRDFAQAVEGLGFEHINCFDHIVGGEPTNRPPGWRTAFTHRTFIHEPLTFFAYLAGITERLEFVSEIVILPQRQTVLFAKQAAEVDYLSNGRLRLGVAIGWNELEFDVQNENFHNRGRRIEEQVEVLRRFWTQEVVEFHGRWHHVDRAGINPMPVQRPIPLWMGGRSEPVLRRAARLADGWMPLFDPTVEANQEMTRTLKQYVKEAGRDPASFGIEGRINLANATPEDWRRSLDAWRALDATHVTVATTGAGYTGLEQHTAVLRRFREMALQAS